MGSSHPKKTSYLDTSDLKTVDYNNDNNIVDVDVPTIDYNSHKNLKDLDNIVLKKTSGKQITTKNIVKKYRGKNHTGEFLKKLSMMLNF